MDGAIVFVIVTGLAWSLLGLVGRRARPTFSLDGIDEVALAARARCDRIKLGALARRRATDRLGGRSS